jgi:hypothetical protein
LGTPFRRIEKNFADAAIPSDYQFPMSIDTAYSLIHFHCGNMTLLREL